MKSEEGPPATPGDLRPDWITMLRLIADGMTERQVAKHMNWSPHTIHYRFARIRELSGARTKAHIIAWAFNEGLLLLDKELKPYKDMQASLSGVRSKNRELTQELSSAKNRIAELESELRVAHTQLGSVPWQTTNRTRI